MTSVTAPAVADFEEQRARPLHLGSSHYDSPDLFPEADLALLSTPPPSPADKIAPLKRDNTAERIAEVIEEVRELASHVERDVPPGVVDGPEGLAEAIENVRELAEKVSADVPEALENVGLAVGKFVLTDEEEKSPTSSEGGRPLLVEVETEEADLIELPHISVKSDGASIAEKEESKRKKKVSFCGDSDVDLVTRFVEAPDPWRHAKESSVQTVLEAYAHMCLNNKVQPLPKVLESIKRNPGNRQRRGTFDLSGERIDLNTVDTFEAIFMRMCFEELNLDGCLTDDELAVALMDMLEYYQFADRLVVSHNKKLQFRGWLAVAKILKKCCIYYLDIRGCILQDQYASLLTRALRIGSNIVTLHMENCNLSGRPMFLLISALQFSETVQELFLADNRLTPTDMIHVGAALKHGWKIKLLDLRNNSILDSGAGHLFDSMDDDALGHWGLRSLVLWSNHLTSQMAKNLSRALARTGTLETLNLGMNDLADDFIFTIKESLMKNRTLRRLGLQSCRISNEGCIALAEFLADHPRFLRLDLRNNDIRAGGWLALAHAAKMCPGLIRLDVSYDVKDAKHTDTIREAQKLIQTTCVNNIDEFDKGTAVPTATLTEETAAELTEGDEVFPEVLPVAKQDDSPPTLLPPLTVREEEPSGYYPEFFGNFAKPPDPDVDIDMPKKSSFRRMSITSVTATGPPSVCDRLHEELFPVSPIRPTTVAANPIVKGRFQISLVKATEKIYQHVQNVLSPTSNGNIGFPGPQTPESPLLSSPSVEGKSIINSWKNTFRRGSKEVQPTELAVVAAAEKKDKKVDVPVNGLESTKEEESSVEKSEVTDNVNSTS